MKHYSKNGVLCSSYISRELSKVEIQEATEIEDGETICNQEEFDITALTLGTILKCVCSPQSEIYN